MTPVRDISGPLARPWHQSRSHRRQQRDHLSCCMLTKRKDAMSMAWTVLYLSQSSACQHEGLTLLDDDIVKKTTTAEMMARDSCAQKEIQAIRLHISRQSWL